MHTVESYTLPSVDHFEPASPTEQRIVEHLHKVAAASGLLNPSERIIWTVHGTPLNRSYRSQNRI